MKKALEGIRVIDLSHVLAAPTTTMFLGDLGAEVIHLEPPHGDDAREYGPFAGTPGKNHSGYFISLNRNKKSLVLNLKLEKGREILRELIKVSDILVENFRPSTMKKMGFGWEELQKLNPRLIYAAISGFGHDSPPEYAARPSYDMVAQAYSGLMSITGPVGGPPLPGGLLRRRYYLRPAGHHRHSGRPRLSGEDRPGTVLRRLHGGRSVCRPGECRGPLHDDRKDPGPSGRGTPLDHPPSRPSRRRIPGSSSPPVTMSSGPSSAKSWGREDLIKDPRFENNHLRTENQSKLSEILTSELVKKTTAEWIAIFEKEQIPYSPINNMKQICEDPVIRHRNMLVTVDQPDVGPVRIAGSPIRLSETPGRVESPAPLLGEHSEEVLRTVLGYDKERIAALKAEGVINATV